MDIKNGDCLHIVSFGTFNENKYFLSDYRDAFDIICFNANIIAHAPSGIASFVAQLKNKSYFIDPLIYAFQQPIKTVMKKEDDKWELKKSIEKLSKIYGSIITEKAGIEPIKISDITELEIIEISKNVLKFQFKIIQDSCEDLDVKEFLEFNEKTIRPRFLIAPYFFLDPDSIEISLDKNISFINSSKEIIENNKELSKQDLFAEIVLDKEVLFDKEKVKSITDKYKECYTDGFIIWVDDFAEFNSSETALIKYKEFLNRLAENNKPIINLHGSYFSIILSNNDNKLLAGVGHGIEYGEHRPVIPVGGGVPLAKFYFPKFYKRVNYDPTAEDILLEMDWVQNKEKYLKNVCNCKMCQNLVKDDVFLGFHEYGVTKISEKNGKLYPDAKAMDKSRKHYLNNKLAEYDFCRKNDLSVILSSLGSSQNLARNIKSHSFAHLSKWYNVLK